MRCARLANFLARPSGPIGKTAPTGVILELKKQVVQERGGYVVGAMEGPERPSHFNSNSSERELVGHDAGPGQVPGRLTDRRADRRS